MCHGKNGPIEHRQQLRHIYIYIIHIICPAKPLVRTPIQHPPSGHSLAHGGEKRRFGQLAHLSQAFSGDDSEHGGRVRCRGLGSVSWGTFWSLGKETSKGGLWNRRPSASLPEPLPALPPPPKRKKTASLGRVATWPSVFRHTFRLCLSRPPPHRNYCVGVSNWGTPAFLLASQKTLQNTLLLKFGEIARCGRVRSAESNDLYGKLCQERSTNPPLGWQPGNNRILKQMYHVYV